MEKVTAYKAFNGRLFLSEEDCLRYEKKMSAYPKRTELTETADDICSPDGTRTLVDIVKHTVKTKTSPSSETKSEVFYVVGGKYKLSGCCKEETMLHRCMNPDSQDAYTYWGFVDQAVAEYILYGGTIDLHALTEICERYHEREKYSRMHFEVLEPLRKWRIEDLRWHGGSIAPFFVIIEKI